MVCGIDIGGTKLQLTVYGRTMNEVHSRREPTPVNDYRVFLNVLNHLVRSADDTVGERLPVGLAFPGILARDGRAISTNIPCVHGKTVMADIEETLGRDIVHLNDTRAFTLSESRGGALEGALIGMGIILGTGVAGALCVGGLLYGGSQGLAGEYGHMPLPRNLLEKYALPSSHCACGSDGCAEAFLSGPGLLRIGSRFGVACNSAEELLRQDHRIERNEVHHGRWSACRFEPGHDVRGVQCGTLRPHRLVRSGTHGFPVPCHRAGSRSATRANRPRLSGEFRGRRKPPPSDPGLDRWGSVRGMNGCSARHAGVGWRGSTA